MQLFNFPKTNHFKADVISGITVGIITIPQAMAFALLAGLPPIYGLYGSLIPLVVFAFFASSNVLNVGPVSVISIFIFESLTPFVSPFTEEYLNAVILLGIMIGLVQLLAGILQFGKFLDFIPKSVISGFVQAAAVVIIISQLPLGIGFQFPLETNSFEKVIYLFQQLDQIHLFTFLLFTSSLIILFSFSVWFPSFPTAILLLFITGTVAYLFHLEKDGIALIGEVPEGLPVLLVPVFSWQSLQYLPSAVGIAFVATMGSYVMAKNVDTRQETIWNPNQDMIALGLSKIVSAFFGSLIPAGSFNRSILSIKTGARTQVSSLVAATIILLTLLFLTPVVYFLPQPVIAAIIVYSVYFLFDFPLIKRLWQTDKKECFFLLITAMVTLMIGFIEGIVSGLICALIVRYLIKTNV